MEKKSVLNDSVIQNQVISRTKSSMAESISKIVLLAFSFLLPIFFIPNVIFPFQAGKILLVSVAASLSFIFWLISRLRAGNFKLPKHLIFYSMAAIIIFGLVSTLFSGSIMESFAGISGESNTYLFILMSFILLFVSFKTFRSAESVLKLYIAIFLSAFILMIFQLLRIFLGVDFLDFGVLVSSTSNILGRWNDLSIFFGLCSIVSIITLELFKPSRLIKILLYIFTFLSLFIVAIVNSLLTWMVIGVTSLLLSIYLYSKEFRKEENLEENLSLETPTFSRKGRKFIKLSSMIFILSIVFVLLRVQIGAFVSDKFNISQIEARPSLVSTLKVAQSTLNQSPGFGAGSNRFSIEWGLYKPIGVNNTIFWNTNFNYGIGVLPTFLVTSGVLGFLAWLLFLGSLIVLGVKVLFSKIEDQAMQFTVLSSFLASLYLWSFAVITVPGIAVLALTFILTGAFLASTVSFGFIKYKEISLSDDSKVGFISVFSLILALIISAGLLYLSSSRYLSTVFTQKAILEINRDNDLAEAFKKMERSIALAKTDSSYRLLSQLYVIRLNNLLNDQSLAGTEEATRQFQEILGMAISSAQKATEIDPEDHRNWMTLGSIYEAIVPLRVQGAYESAKRIYERAMRENPTNPAVDLALARLEVSNGNNSAARVEINDALQKKNNYTDAIFLLSQIEINEGNIKEAIQAVEAASIINPNDALTFFQLGFLKFNQRDFNGAITALERAVAINPPYSNAKYFLGLSYYGLGRNSDAVAQFEDIEELNPDNQEVKAILRNLQAGNEPFLNLNTDDPTTREELPVQNSQ